MLRSIHAAAFLTLAALAAVPALAQEMTPAQRTARAAILNGDLDRLREALSEGWDPNARDQQGRPGWWQVLPFEFFAALPVLFEAGADPEAKTEAAFHALHYAVDQERPALITALLENGVDPDMRGLLSAEDRTDMSRTGLHHAAATGCEPCARALVAGGANANALDMGNATPLRIARHFEHQDIVRYLEGLGATEDPDEAAGNPLRRPGAPPPVGGRDPGAPGRGGEDCVTQVDLSSLTGEGGVGAGDCEDDGGGAAGRSRDRGRDGGRAEGGRGSREGSWGGAGALPPPRPARPVHEVNVANVLGGPLSGLWGAFRGRHADWGLDSNGHITNLEGGATITSGSRIDSLPTDWAQELHQIGVEQGLVLENPAAPYLVAPRGGLAQVMAAEQALIQAERQAAAAGGEPGGPLGTTAAQRPGN